MLLGFAVIAAFTLSVGGNSARAASSPGTSVAPNSPYNMLDCNGWSTTYKPVVPSMKMRCTDPIGSAANGWNGKFVDNGHYIGHDEPSVKFESPTPGSGNTMTYFQQLSRDPIGTPTSSPAGTTTSNYAELSPAPWFGLGMCDPNSAPNGPCLPDSDTNNPNLAGSAFMELQFYPPKFGPWLDGISMDPTKWTVALNIDSLECPGGAPVVGCAQPNPMCVEPVNFALLTLDGVPTGPPSPQSADLHTFNENADTLLMNPGDTT
jgi:hypothetical protein